MQVGGLPRVHFVFCFHRSILVDAAFNPRYDGNMDAITHIHPGQLWARRTDKNLVICIWLANNEPGKRVAGNKISGKRYKTFELTPESLRADFILIANPTDAFKREQAYFNQEVG